MYSIWQILFASFVFVIVFKKFLKIGNKLLSEIYIYI